VAAVGVRADGGAGKAPAVTAWGLAADRPGLDADDAAFLAEVVAALERDPFVPAHRLARGLYVSPSHLAHRFRAVAGFSPGALAVALRMREAKRLLAGTGLPVLQVALDVGYDSLGTFTTRFSQLVGASPGRFRARLDVPMPPVLTPDPGAGEAAVTGRISAPPGAVGVAFVGLFPSYVPAGRPLCGAVAPVPGIYRLPRCAPGWYRVLAAGFLAPPSRRDLVLSRADMVGAGRQPVRVGFVGEATCDLEMRPPTLGDPPVVVSLGLLGPADPARG